MIYRQLGKSGLNVSLIGYGGWALAKEGWGNVDEKQACATVIKAFELGINFFDTAPIYGKGKSEQLIGTLLSDVRKKIIIATKCGLRWDDTGKVHHDLTKDGIRRDLESSLERLKTNYIDLYQVHWPDPNTPLEETFSTLLELKKQGIIKNIGVCNFDSLLLDKVLSLAGIVSIQSLYNIIQKNAEYDLFPAVNKNELGFIAYSALAQGLLSGQIGRDYRVSRKDVRRFNPLYSDKHIFLKKIGEIEKIEKPLYRSAIKYLIDRKEVSSFLISMTRLKHLEDNIRAVIADA